MTLLSALGIDQTIFIQFGLFAVVFFFLTFFLFKPYAKALEQREQRTVGGEAAAEETVRRAAELRQRYEVRAREVSAEIKKIFDNYRAEASQESEKIVSKARTQAQQMIEQGRSKLTEDLGAARARLKEEIPVLSQAIVAKLLSKKV